MKIKLSSFTSILPKFKHYKKGEMTVFFYMNTLF